jgi:ankyrin repeat protein
MIKAEREREDRKREKELKEKQIRQKREARKKRFMEAAYDGNMTELNFLIADLNKELDDMYVEIDSFTRKPLDEAKRKEAHVSLIDCKDKNNNSALSEAASGGSADVVKFLLKGNADPNSRGMFGRTPIWRAAFAGHLNCVQILLENGADPRINSQDGQRVLDSTTNEQIVNLLTNWNIQLTERMLAQIDKHKLEFKREQMASLDAKKKAAHDELKKLTKMYDTVKNELFKCTSELQRLHDEYLLNEKMYGELIEKKELEKADVVLRYEDLREKTTKARISYKDLLEEVKKDKRSIKKSKGLTADPNNDDHDDDKYFLENSNYI